LGPTTFLTSAAVPSLHPASPKTFRRFLHHRRNQLHRGHRLRHAKRALCRGYWRRRNPWPSQSAAKTFDPATSGTYTALIYEKANAQNEQKNIESGTPTQGVGTVTVSSAGSITITDSQSNTLATGPLVAAADSSYLYDGTANELSDLCFGLFTVRIASATSQQDPFVSFQGNAAIFASFQSALPAASTNPYTYFYGVGLK
jgi:hypothetical protein